MKTDEQRLKEIPQANASWATISNYALLFNGYEHKEHLGDFANKIANDFSVNKTLPDELSINDLKSCLFYEQRRFRHFGSDPEEEAFEYIQTLVNEIREKTIKSIVG